MTTRAKLAPIAFEVLWYSGGPDYAPNRCIGRDIIKRQDLSAAIVWACNTLKKPRGNESAAMAHGFYVRSLRDNRAEMAKADRLRASIRKVG